MKSNQIKNYISYKKHPPKPGMMICVEFNKHKSKFSSMSGTKKFVIIKEEFQYLGLGKDELILILYDIEDNTYTQFNIDWFFNYSKVNKDICRREIKYIEIIG